jgi:hypothetical protein
MTQSTKTHVQSGAPNATRKVDGKKAGRPGLQGDEKIGGKVKKKAGQAG